MDTYAPLSFLVVSAFLSLAIGISISWMLLRQKAEISREQGSREARADLATRQERTSQIPKLTADLSQALANNRDILSKVSDLKAQVVGATQERQSLEKDVIQLQEKIRETESDRENLRSERDQLSIAKMELATTIKKERLQTEELYDKFVGFVNTSEMVGKRLDDAKNAYQEAFKQLELATGKGNLIRQAEKFKELGVQPTKSDPQRLTEATKTDEEKFLTQQVETSPSTAETNS